MMLDTILTIVFLMLSLALVLAVYRFLIGPDLSDRVIALDLIAMIIAAFVIAYMIYADEPVFMDAVVIATLITFFGTVAFAQYLQKGVEKR